MGIAVFIRACARGLAGLVTASCCFSVNAADAPPSPPSAAASASASAPLSAEAFFRRDDIEAAQLSPSGHLLAVTALLADKRYALAVFDLDQPGSGKAVAHFDDADIGNFQWVNDERLVFDIYDQELGSGEQRYAAGLYSVKRDGSEMRTLVLSDIRSASRPGDRALDYKHILLHVPAGGGDEVVIGEVRLDGVREVMSVLPKRLNVVTGRVSSLAYGAPPYALGWLFDAQGLPRVAITRHEGRTKVFWRTEVPGSDTPQWQQLADHPSFEMPWSPRAVDSKGRLYVTTQEGPAQRLVLKRFDFATGQPEREPLVSTPGFDYDGSLIAEAAGGRLLGLRVDTDAEQTVWLEPRLKALQAEIDRRLPGRINRLSCRRCTEADATVLVWSYSDQFPGQYWVWRGPVTEPTMWRAVGERRTGLSARGMARLDFDRFRARDGLEIPVWLTLPPQRTAGQRLPAVVLPHGGPNVRGGHWHWDPMPQFLASRGYVVIEPEFRGSAGFGAVHLTAGFKQWGRAMQDDLADAVAWAAGKGYIDPSRVCIAGASYGGYAALMGLVRNPDLYRCGVAWVAVTEPSLLFKSSWASDVDEESRRYRLPVTLGDPVADAEMLRSISPVQQAARIKAPLLLAFGELDRRVPIAHGKLMLEALQAAGQDPEYVVYPGEGHSWLLTQSRVDFAQRMERFLARNLK